MGARLAESCSSCLLQVYSGCQHSGRAYLEQDQRGSRCSCTFEASVTHTLKFLQEGHAITYSSGLSAAYAVCATHILYGTVSVLRAHTRLLCSCSPSALRSEAVIMDAMPLSMCSKKPEAQTLLWSILMTSTSPGTFVGLRPP